MSADGKALVLFSGGQDSATCLAWALERFSVVETVAFNYGQRHKIELECREEFLAKVVEINPAWKERLGPDHKLDLSVLGKISQSSLTQEAEIALREDGLPNTFVPGRNLLFFTLAAAVAYRRQLRHLVGGMCETDYSGYPDCRDDTLKSLQVTLNLGMGSNCVVDTPLMWIDKAATWQMADDLGGDQLVNLIKTSTHTCYLGVRDNEYDWGFGCGECPACDLRITGYKTYIANPTV